LCERYFRRLVGLARKKLLDLPRTASDEEDVAQCAFHSFCRRAEQGLFPRLDDRQDLWQILVLITVRKVHDLKAYECCRKRDGRRTVSLNHGPEGDSDAEKPGFVQLISRDLDPGFEAEMAERYRQLLAKLPDEELRTIAQRKLEGYTNEEIALQLGTSLARV